MSSSNQEKVRHNKKSINGLLFNDQYILPQEILLNILSHHIDYKSLLSCQLVCKQWNHLVKSFVWRKKAELTVNHKLPLDENIPWTSYYNICHNRPINKNLIRDHSGQNILLTAEKSKNKSFPKCTVRDCSREHFLIENEFICEWTITRNGGHKWAVESPPLYVPVLPDDPVFDGKNCCFVTSGRKCWKEQIIDLVAEGITTHILDSWQPTIKVSEWFSSPSKSDSIYACRTELLTEEGVILTYFNFSKKMKNEERNKWFKFEHEFRNYGKGLRKIKFSDGGQDARFWSGHYGSKMAGACIKLEIPDSLPQMVTPQVNYFSPEAYYFSYDEFSDSASDADDF